MDNENFKCNIQHLLLTTQNVFIIRYMPIVHMLVLRFCVRRLNVYIIETETQAVDSEHFKCNIQLVILNTQNVFIIRYRHIEHLLVFRF